jgi:hypothetical protein
LSVAQKQTQSAQIIAGLNNANAVAVQNLQNQAALANIAANGAVTAQITNLTNANKTLLQTSQGAATLYSQALVNLQAIMTNPNLSTDQQTTALNNGVQQLQSGLDALAAIANNQPANALLTFSNPAPAAAAAPAAPSPGQFAGGAPANNNPTIPDFASQGGGGT